MTVEAVQGNHGPLEWTETFVDLFGSVTGRTAKGLQMEESLQMSDIFISLKWQEETN